MQALLDYLSETNTTQRQFAALVGVREATVTAWLQGIKPRPERMERIAKITNGKVPVTAWFECLAGTAEC